MACWGVWFSMIVCMYVPRPSTKNQHPLPQNPTNDACSTGEQRAALAIRQAAERRQHEERVRLQAEQRRADAIDAKKHAAQLLDERRGARHAREAAAEAERARAWRARRMAGIVRAIATLAAGLEAARKLQEARMHMQQEEEAVLVIQKCYRVSDIRI